MDQLGDGMQDKGGETQNQQQEASESEEDDGRKVFEEDPEIRRKTVGYSDKPYFDGVYDCDPIPANDTVAENELIEGMVESTAELQAELENLVASVMKVRKLFDEEDSEPPSELEALLNLRVRMLLSYVTLLQAYASIKVAGDWFPEHKVASMLVEVRQMIVEVEVALREHSQEMQEAVEHVAHHAQAMEHAAYESLARGDTPARPSLPAPSLPTLPSARSRSKAPQQQALEATTKQGQDSTKNANERERGGEGRVQKKQKGAGREWLSGDTEREGPGAGSGAERLQGLLWRAGAIEEKMKQGALEPTAADRWLVENKEKVAEQWTTAFQQSATPDKPETGSDLPAPWLRNKLTK